MHKSSQTLSTHALIGQDIKSWDGKNLGRIEELIIDPVTHRIVSAVLSPSSSANPTATVSWEALGLSAKDDSLYVQDVDGDPDSQPTRVVVYTTQICRHGV